MRDILNLFEAGKPPIPLVSDDLLKALRAWGSNTVFDRPAKEAALRGLSAEISRFRATHDWLYRGQGVSLVDLRTLRKSSKASIEITLPGTLSSWTPDSDIAHTFAQFGDAECSLVLMKRNLVTFFDFARLGIALEQAGLAPKEAEYDLHDPIRETEVVVDHPATMRISRSDVLEYFWFDRAGNQKHGRF